MSQDLINKYSKAERRLTYGDIRNNMQVHPGSKDLYLTTETDTIKNCIFNLLKTSFYERPFQPKLGSLLSSLLFENMDNQTLLFAQQMIRDTIALYEPRALVNEINVSTAPDDNGVYITIVYSVINNDKPITINLLLDKVR